MTDTLTAKKIVSTAYSIASNLLDLDWSEDEGPLYILTKGEESLWITDLGGVEWWTTGGYLVERYTDITNPDGGMPVEGLTVDSLEDVADHVALFVSFSGADIIAEASK